MAGLYNYQWQKASRQYLVESPLCVYCLRMGGITPATVVDHIIPHKGDDELFWDTANWQALCKSCHDSVKQKEESGKIDGACDQMGNPVSSAHHWNK